MEFDYSARHPRPNHFLHRYMSLLSGTRKVNKDEGNASERKDFSRGYALYAFDLTPDMKDGYDHLNLLR